VETRYRQRYVDLIVTPEGRFVGRLDAAFLFSPGIRLSQIVQHEKDSIEVKIVRDAGFSENDMENLEEQLRFRLGDGIAIKYRFVEDIPVTPGGKLKFVISDLSVGKKFRVGEN
jgi:phenylacetate-CoA ligase